jgi:hypothetical protein
MKKYITRFKVVTSASSVDHGTELAEEVAHIQDKLGGSLVQTQFTVNHWTDNVGNYGTIYATLITYILPKNINPRLKSQIR